MKRILTRLIRLRNERLAAQELRKMPAYLLRDIGITRDQIDAYVRNELPARDVRSGTTTGGMNLPGIRQGARAQCCAA